MKPDNDRMLIETAPDNAIWYVICTHPATEDRCAAGLHARKYTVYAPSVFRRVPTGHRDANGHKQVKEISRAMFPGYLFIRFAQGAEDFAGVRKVPGVREFLKINARPAVVPLAALEMMASTEAEQFAKYEDEVARQKRAALPRRRQPSPFKAGDTVKISEGPFVDWIAKVERADDLGRVVLLFELFGRETRTIVDSDALEATA